MDMSLLIPEGDSLVTYYMLPLVGLNKASFGNTFKASYIGSDGLKVYVELKRNMTSPAYKQNPNYITSMVFEGTPFLLFTLPSQFIESAGYFVKGLYSKMSREAKQLIYTTSGLPYNKTTGSFVMSHPILQALDNTGTLRTFLLNHLAVKKIADSNELINPPYDWWFIENRIKQNESISSR